MFSIAIDGPAAAGKTTQAKAIAKELGFLYVDTGALYRAVALAYFRCFDREYRKPFEINQTFLSELNIELQHQDGEQITCLNGEDVSSSIRIPHISKMASDLSAKPVVREYLLDRQRTFAREGHVVMEGRDIGSVVLPDATLKIYLTASKSERACRRYLQMGCPENPSLSKVLNDLRLRDWNDANRKVAPLTKTEDAVMIDSTEMTPYEVTWEIIRLFKDKVRKEAAIRCLV